MMKPGRGTIAALALAAAFAMGMGLEYGIMKPKPGKVETYAPEIRQKDQSLILERKPQADAKPAQEIPKGAKVERVVQVVVQPRAVLPKSASGTSEGATVQTNGEPQQDKVSLPGATLPNLTPCPPVRIDLSLVRMPDQTRRVIASSPDGDVVGGVDIPTETPDRPKVLKWAAGGIYGWSNNGKSAGAFLHRDIGPFRAGLEVTKDTFNLSNVPGQWSARLIAGIRF